MASPFGWIERAEYHGETVRVKYVIDFGAFDRIEKDPWRKAEGGCTLSLSIQCWVYIGSGEDGMPLRIDIHNHIFSGRDIPLNGYLSSRRYDEWYIRLFAPVLFPLIADYIRQEGPSALKPLEKIIFEMGILYLGEGHRRWADILSLQSAADIARRMIETYNQDSINLFVPLMIDFEYWFSNSVDHAIADQVQLVYRDVVLPYRGRIHPFAPFDPVRELAFRAGMPGPDGWQGGAPETCSSLELLKDAIRTKGFIGVKVYNTLGYRPLGNADVDAERQSIFKRNEMDRYASFSGEDIDEIMHELYAFCAEEQVPITAHCVSNGIEAYPEASLVFGGPRFWRPVLDRFPSLHLNLAHYGWSRPDAYALPRRAHWFQRVNHRAQRWVHGQNENLDLDIGREDWTVEITKMLAIYPHLFTDVAHHGVVIPSYQGGMLASYRAICRDYPGLISQRLLYGTDWHVFARMDNFQKFQAEYVRLLAEGQIFSQDEMNDFLGRNALRFLGLLPVGTPPEMGWCKNRERLGAFYQKENIDPPGWFKTTA
jgi:predicted TIM-barrel fold metal-dependent hydrolase